MKLHNWLKPYPLMVVATFVVPVMIHNSVDTWPGTALVPLTFVLFGVAALALEKHHKED